MRRLRRSRSRVLACAVAGFGAAAAASAYGQVNLLANGGFENPPVPGAPVNQPTNVAPLGWELYGNAYRANYYNNTPGGDWSIWLQAYQAPGGAYQTYTGGVTAGATYTMSAYWLFEPGYPQTDAVSDMEIYWQNNSGGEVGTPAQLLIQPYQVNANETWSQYQVSGMAPAGATEIVAEFDVLSNDSSVGGQQSAFVDDASLTGPGTPPANYWAATGSGQWQADANWSNGTANLGVGADSEFLSEITAPSNVYTDTAITTGTIHFNNSNEYVLDGAGSLTLQVSTGSALVKVDQATDEINLPTTIASNTVFNVATGATLMIGNPMTINSGMSVTQTGGGKVVYNSIVNVASGGAIVLGNSTQANTLEIGSTSTATIAGSGNTVQVGTLSNSGLIDITKNELLISYLPGNDPDAGIAAEIKSGFNNGGWNGSNGILSSSARTLTNGLRYGVGWADGADKAALGVTTGQIEIKYTLLGDANLDGVVNGSDFALLAANFGQGVTNWDQGNFLFTSAVNGADFAAMAANFGQGDSLSGVSGVSAADLAALDAFAAANGLPSPTIGAVPEPASIGLLVIGALGLTARRRRSVCVNGIVNSE